MSSLRSFHEEHGGEYTSVGGRPTVEHYGRPERSHLAVRNGVGVIERPVDVVIVTGADRVEYVDNVLSNAIPRDPGRGVYALLLDPHGRVRLDAYVYTAEDRLLVFLPPGWGNDLAAEWRERVFIQDVSLEVATDDYAVFSVTGPSAGENIGQLTSASIPESPFEFVQATVADAGVTVIRTDDLTGEQSYDLVCARHDAEVVFRELLNTGTHAIPFGQRTWETLTLEAGTPLFDTELEGELPNVAGIRNGIDFEKGCFVGQEVVSRIENRGNPNERLVGLTLQSEACDAGTVVMIAGEEVGRLTRTDVSPSLDTRIAMGYLPYDIPDGTVEVAGEAATIASFPFVDGSGQSLRIPRYPD